jgi:hypothetical protein
VTWKQKIPVTIPNLPKHEQLQGVIKPGYKIKCGSLITYLKTNFSVNFHDKTIIRLLSLLPPVCVIFGTLWTGSKRKQNMGGEEPPDIKRTFCSSFSFTGHSSRFLLLSCAKVSFLRFYMLVSAFQ